jgi:AcrR family transcriptional regulator
MAYRATERTEAKRAEARERIVGAALELVAAGGYREAQVAAVAKRARVATGTVYRHFPSKGDLVTEVFRVASQREVDAVAAATAARGTAPERIGAAVDVFARRALRGRRLAWALLAEPVDPGVEAERLLFRHAYADVFARAIEEGIAAGELPPQDAALTAAALVGAIGEALVGPLSPTHDAPAAPSADALVAGLTTFCLRATTDQEPSPDVHRRAA